MGSPYAKLSPVVFIYNNTEFRLIFESSWRCAGYAWQSVYTRSTASCLLFGTKVKIDHLSHHLHWLQREPQSVSLSRFKLVMDTFIKLFTKRDTVNLLLFFFIYTDNFIKLFIVNHVYILLLNYHSSVLMGKLFQKIYICF